MTTDDNGSAVTDREALDALLRRFGITPFPDGAPEAPPDPDSVVLMAGHGRVGGYHGFCAVFEFDPAGKFTGVAMWE